MKIKRNYQFIQFLLDFLALFFIYLITDATVNIFIKVEKFNTTIIKAEAGSVIEVNPAPVLIWGVLAVLVFISAIVLPFVFKKKMKLNQVQFDWWVYAVYTIRVLVLTMIVDLLGKHINFLMHSPESLFSFSVLGNGVLIFAVVWFTRKQIKKNCFECKE